MACTDTCAQTRPRVAIIGLASCFGCQLQITNDEAHLLDVLGQIELSYWQLASSAPEPQGDVDVVVVEGAVTTEESRRCVQRWRERCRVMIAVGACAVTGGIPGMASDALVDRCDAVYGGDLPDACGAVCAPCSVSSVVRVDFEVRSCPIDTADFIRVLEQALYGSNRFELSDTMCGSCKRNESGCLWREGKQCLGLVTLAGCGAKCVALGRECNGCRGLSPHANVAAARRMVAAMGMDVDEFDRSLELFNQTNPLLQKENR